MGRRLPTEAEWEKAARGTDGRAYPWGSDWVSARSARRHWHLLGNWTGYYGFRCVQDLR